MLRLLHKNDANVVDGDDDDDDEKGPYFIPTSLPRGESRPGYLPARLWVLMTLMARAFTVEPKYDCGDMFAGKCAISKAFIRQGLKACALDIALDGRDDP